jgi:hypothetical protein
MSYSWRIFIFFIILLVEPPRIPSIHHVQPPQPQTHGMGGGGETDVNSDALTGFVQFHATLQITTFLIYRCLEFCWYNKFTTHIDDGLDTTQTSGLLCYRDGSGLNGNSGAGLAVYKDEICEVIHTDSRHTGVHHAQSFRPNYVLSKWHACVP